MMHIISHRGYWKTAEERNTRRAFERSFRFGFGTETDVRDRDGQLVVSHDMASASNMSIHQFLEIYGQCGLPLALNIKADGLAESLRAALQLHQVSNYFVFDCAVPDLREHMRIGNTAYTRLSDAEPTPAWSDKAQGIWLDSFESDWYESSDIESWLAQGKGVCVVSPELHGRDPTEVWKRLLPLSGDGRLMLCTDLPEKAREYFALGSQ